MIAMATTRSGRRINAPTIRRLVPADFPAYIDLVREADDLHHRAIPRVIRSPTQARPRISEFQAAVRDPDQRLFGAVVGDRLVGFAHAQLCQNPGGRAHRPFRYISLELIAVTATSRRRGIGRALTGAIATWARSRKARLIHLGVYEFNRGAIAFYEKLGFKIAIRYMDLAVK